ncbi:MAG: CpsD/CapB family tyrosine-protein kinase, partial [Candidatus Hydrogenedentota bacterium]
NIMFLFRGKISFVITSTLPVEGKTTILANLALTFAEIEKRTLILSCNLRNPQLHKYFRINNNSGITDWFVSNEPIEKYILDTYESHLKIINSGEIQHNPSIIFTSSKFKKLLATLKRKFDVIIIDSPSVISVNDTALILSIIKNVVMVSRLRKIDSDTLLKATKIIIENCKAQILGLVLNDY